MPRCTNTSLTLAKHSARAVTGWLVCGFLAVILFVAQSMPMSAGASSDGNWIEICGGENGSYFVEMDDDSPQQSPMDCVHCDGCLMVSNVSDAPNTVDWPANVPSGISLVNFSPAQTFGLAGAEQFWSASRGPPLEKSGNRMPKTYILASLAHALAPLSTWSDPCS